MAMLITVPLFPTHAQTTEGAMGERVGKFLERDFAGTGQYGFASYSVAVACTKTWSVVAGAGPGTRDGAVQLPRDTCAG